MANTLSVYDPLFYAQEAIIQLEKSLGMAGRVHRGYDKAPQQKGSVISISRPSTFTVADAPASAQDITAGEVQISLNYWREVKFKLTDKELTYTTEKIIADHIRPAAYALADDIDQKLVALYKEVPWSKAASSPAAVADITAVQRIMFNNRVPEDDMTRHLMLSGVLREEFLNLSAFSQWQGAGADGVNTQMRGSLGLKYGYETFANQNTPTHTTGTASTGTLAINNGAGYAAGVSTINLDAGSVTGTLVPGDILAIAGHTQQYVVTNTVTASSNAFAGVTISPALAASVADNAVVTATLTTGTVSLGFHRNAFALAMAPLSEMGNQLGARIATVIDPITGLALRSRMYYVGNSSEVHVALDVLYGVKTLDGNLACRLIDA